MRSRRNPPSIWRLLDYGVTVYRRRAHLVTVNTDSLLTVAPWPLYWCGGHECRTFAQLSRVGDEGLWLPLVDLVGHWDWFAGEVVDVRVLDGYGPDPMPTPKYEHIWRTNQKDPDTGATYWRSDRGRLRYWRSDPMAHT